VNYRLMSVIVLGACCGYGGGALHGDTISVTETKLIITTPFPNPADEKVFGKIKMRSLRGSTEFEAGRVREDEELH